MLESNQLHYKMGCKTVAYMVLTCILKPLPVACLRRNQVNTVYSTNKQQSNNGIIEKHCINNLQANCDIYGGLYEWGEMVQYLNGASNYTSWNPAPTGPVQGICPPGWHIPGSAEWNALTDYIGGSTFAGGKMKEIGTTHWATPNAGATNSSAFTGLPGGYWDDL